LHTRKIIKKRPKRKKVPDNREREKYREMERDCGLRRLKDKKENQKGGPPKNASRMPLCAESPFSFEEPCCDIHGEITMGWQKTGLIITMKKSVLASAHGGE
jgi:hypothetical protein